MYYGQGRKQVNPIMRYRMYHHCFGYTLMHEIVLYEHCVAYYRVYRYCGNNTYVVAKRISMKDFRIISKNSSWTLFN